VFAVGRWTFTFVTLAKRPKVTKRVDAGTVPVSPLESERVIAYLLDVAKLEIASGSEARLELTSRNEADGTRMPLASGAGAITAQDFVRVDAVVAIGPGNFEDPSIAGSLHARRMRTRIGLHARA